MRAGVIFATALMAFIIMAGPAMAMGKGSLTGTVTSPEGVLSPGHTVCVQKQAGECEKSSVTDEQGQFNISAINPGWEFVSVAGEGIMYGQWVWVAPDSSQSLSIKLQPAPEK